MFLVTQTDRTVCASCLCALSIAPGPNLLFRLSQYLITRLDPTQQLDQHAYNTLSNKLSKTEGFHKHSPLHKHTQVYTCESHSLKLLSFLSLFFFLLSDTHTHTHARFISESRSSKNHTTCLTQMKLIKHYRTSCDNTFIKTAHTPSQTHTDEYALHMPTQPTTVLFDLALPYSLHH